MTRAKTQGGGGGKVPRAATQSGGKPKRAVTNSNLFNDLEAAIDALDQSSARHEATKKAAPVPAPPKRSAPGPTPPSAPRTAPPRPPPGAERAAAIRAREARAQHEVALDEIDEAATVPAPRRPIPAPRPVEKKIDADGLPRITPPPTRSSSPSRVPFGLDDAAGGVVIRTPAPERPLTLDLDDSAVRLVEPADDESAALAALDGLDESGSRIPEPASGLSIDVDFEESKPAAKAYPEGPASPGGAYESGPIVRGNRPLSEDARAISVAESPEDDLVIEGELEPIAPLSIAILDEPPYIAGAKQAIAVAGHKVVAAASGQAGIEQIKSLLRSGSVEVLLVGIPGGEPLIETALALAPRRPVVISVIAGKAVDAVKRATAVGADLAIARPLDVDKLAPNLLAASRLHVERNTATNARGTETMLRARLDAMTEHEPGALQPFELFQRVLELELKRSKRYGYPIAVALFSVGVSGVDPPPPGMQGIVRARAGNALIHSIRDIDLATELDQERFLVLLPYTTLSGAAEVARRILGAVTSTNPINAAGKTFSPKIVGAVAGAQPGQPLSFSRLMRDATQALEQARRDGAELAVPMVRQ